jgi:hypothetical protein
MPGGDGADEMILAGAAAAFLLFVFGGGGEDQARPRPAQESGLVSVRQQLIIRVTTGIRPGPPAPATPIRWREGRGPRCIPAARIIGFTAPGESSVDLVFRDRTRIRARLERRCASLGFYRSFYIDTMPDGQICADRDSIRSRTGGECEIDQFRTLRAAR